MALTKAQAEVIEELSSGGYGQIGFLKHDVFQARDNRNNGMRRTLRGLIESGIIEPTGTVDAYRNPYYRIGTKAQDAYQDYLRREWDRQAKHPRPADALADW